VLVLAVACSLPVEAADEEGAVAVRCVRALDVSALDAALPSQTLDAWLAEVATPGFSKPTWQYDNCGKAKGLEPGTALCVRGTARAELERGAVDVAVDIRVGSIGRPPTTPGTYGMEVWVTPLTAHTIEEFGEVADLH
jgi:hypothetical protein